MPVSSQNPDTEELLERAATGDAAAVEQLFDRHRARLKGMIALRMDPRLAARIDPSDVVQESLAAAAQLLPQYLLNRPLPYYPWLRQIAWERLVKLHTRHLRARRSIDREEAWAGQLSHTSAAQLANRLLARGSSPSQSAIRQEVRRRVQTALAQLSPRDREILVLRHLEQLKIGEIAAVLGISEGAVQMRQLRALERLKPLLEG